MPSFLLNNLLPYGYGLLIGFVPFLLALSVVNGVTSAIAKKVFVFKDIKKQDRASIIDPFGYLSIYGLLVFLLTGFAGWGKPERYGNMKTVKKIKKGTTVFYAVSTHLAGAIAGLILAFLNGLGLFFLGKTVTIQFDPITDRIINILGSMSDKGHLIFITVPTFYLLIALLSEFGILPIKITKKRTEEHV